MTRHVFRISIPLLLILSGVSLEAQTTFYDLSATDINGREFEFSQLKGKKVMIVNTASRCALTSQYEDLETLYKEYGGNDFIILGFPTNDFGQQEPGSNEEIAEFCRLNYGVSFPMMAKISVKGDDIHPVYQWLMSEDLNGLEDSKIQWNFQKYLINEKGELVGHVKPPRKPDSREVMKFIED